MKQNKWMEPPWNVFGYSQTSMGWRMGGGEDYKLKWGRWFTHLSQDEKQAYIAQYPEPEDWFEFYHLEPPHNKEDLFAGFEHAGRLRRAYIDKQYELAVLHEEAGHYGLAVNHLGNALFCLMTYTVWEDAQFSEAVERYKTLKRLLIHQMRLNPIIQTSWNTLRQSDHCTQIELPQTRLIAEDYEHMQGNVFLPSELGRTWTKHFEDDTLYIHRHWQKPCVFLVMWTQEKQEYRIAEAWMNRDPAIPRPLTRPPKKPESLLNRLLGEFIPQRRKHASKKRKETR